MKSCLHLKSSKIRSYVLPVMLCLFAAFTSAADRPPNIVYIMADELAYYELSHMGNPYIKTPRIDQMAKDGIRFTQALAASPVCAPLRGQMLTGKHSGHASVRANDGGTPLRAEEATIASALKSKGYATGGFGKWGAGGRDSSGVPEKHGFDVFFGYYDQVHAHSYYPPYLIRNSEEVPLKGNKGGRKGETYSHTEIIREGLEFIRKNKDQPFFCYLPITPPHGMWDIPKDNPAWRHYRDADWIKDESINQDTKNYAAMVSMVDDNVGQVLDLLTELALDDNTVVFFTGDNGGQEYFKSKERPRGFFGPNVNPKTGVEFRGGKGNLYEGGLRIPFLAQWPGKIEAGQVSDLLFNQVDVFPTLTDIAGAESPADLDGLSILPTLLGEDAAGEKQQQHDMLYWEYRSQVAVRKNNWKAIRPKTNGPWELYDLSKDVSETNNVADQHSELLKEMQTFAQREHTPVQAGVYYDKERKRHEADRRAKWGTSGEGPKPKPKMKKQAKTKAGKKPNFIIIYTDNLGYGDIEPFGSTVHRTPNLNRMAKEGRKFTHFSVTAGVCTPSRSSIMTGCYSQRVGMHDNPRDGWVLRPVSPYGLNPSEITIAEVLKEQGYATAMVGKWHLGDQPEFLPTQQGFDYFFGIPYSDDMTADVWVRAKKRKRSNPRAPKFSEIPWPPLPLMENNKVIEAPVDRNGLTKRYTEKANEWIEAHKDEPFFLYFPQAMPGSTSTPFSSPEFRGKSKNGPWGDSIEELDWSQGQLMDKLVELGLEKNTLVIWTSDNGAPIRPEPGNITRGSNQPLHGRGYTTSEGAFRVPTIMWWPGTVPAGTTSNEFCTTMDLLPTFARMAGGKEPQDRKIDGYDIRPLIVGTPGAKTPYKAFYYYDGVQLQAVRSGPWKLFLPLKDFRNHPHFSKKNDNSKTPLLFNVVTDISCKNNVAADHPDIVARLTRFAEAGRADLGDGNKRGAGQRAIGKMENPKPQVLKK